MVSLIQVASEGTIGIFHIGVHRGKTAQDLIAPSLRTLIERKCIRKTGQSIMGDCARLRDHFGLMPQGMCELSYLDNLITEGVEDVTRYVTGGLKALVVKHFDGMKLVKDSGMHADWTQKQLTRKQTEYAATDVYASLMLFHRMNAKTMKMKPAPPLPQDT